jgi:diacylglycerol kinase (ATP)
LFVADSATVTGEIAVLLNPSAGRGRHAAAAKAALSRLEGAASIRVLSAGTREEAEKAGRAAVADGAGALVAMGGDGTVHLALQAVAGTSTPLGIVPVGTGNDMATCFGLPTDPVAAAAVLAEALQSKRHKTFDLARLTTSEGATHWFGAVLAAGFDAIVNERGNSMRWPKGPRRYDIAIVAELARLRPRSYTAVIDGERRSFEAVLLAIGNGTSYGGGMKICPDADLHDGLLDVVWAEPVSRATLMRIKPSVYAGTHIDHPKVRQLKAETIELDSAGIVCYADGERVAPLPITVSASRDALLLLA